jgi:hypothetical protein
MGYRRNFYRASKPTTRNIEVKYAGLCACCGTQIKAGELATYYPVGTIAGVHESKIAHIGGLDGNSRRCADELRSRHSVDAGTNDYAGDGLDARWEDSMRDACGL